MYPALFLLDKDYESWARQSTVLRTDGWMHRHTLIEIIERIKVILNPSGKKAYFLLNLLIECSAERRQFDKNGQQKTIQEH